MNKDYDFDEITLKAYNYLRDKLSYKYVTIRHYKSRWHPIKEYMTSHGIQLVSPIVCANFLQDLYKGRSHLELSLEEKLIEKSAMVLSEYMSTGTVVRKRKVRYLDGPLGQLMKDFLAYKQSLRLTSSTLEKIESHMSKFNFWLTANGVSNTCDIKRPIILSFIRSLDSNKRAMVHDTLISLRSFFKFLYKKGLITENIAGFVPKAKYQSQARLPSYYTAGEIAQLLNAVDRGTIVGKRDYAILAIATYLGLRVSDIARLQFRNIHWDLGTIVLQQYKTGKDITLPLLPVVGNALLDYIQYGRPKSDKPYIFLYIISPQLPIDRQTIAGMINRRFTKAGLRTAGRKHGGHALRNSLVKELLNNNRTLPVISEVLGHKSIASTRHYIRIDTASLRQCALEVPEVDPLFYAQGGGILFL